MAIFENLKNAVKSVIKQNGNQEITGNILQNVLVTMIESLGAGATFRGVANPSTNPGTQDQNSFYLATQNGTYQYFNRITVNDELAIIVNTNGSWQKLSLQTMTSAQLEAVRAENVWWLTADTLVEGQSAPYSIANSKKGLNVMGTEGLHTVLTTGTSSVQNILVIDGAQINQMIKYFECTTQPNVASKEIQATIYNETLKGGAIKIKMQNANTAPSAVKLKINYTNYDGESASVSKPLYYKGAPVTATNTWKAGETVEVYYDGTNYYANNVNAEFDDTAIKTDIAQLFGMNKLVYQTMPVTSNTLSLTIDGYDAVYPKAGGSIFVIVSEESTANSLKINNAPAVPLTSGVQGWKSGDLLLITYSPNVGDIIPAAYVYTNLTALQRDKADKADISNLYAQMDFAECDTEDAEASKEINIANFKRVKGGTFKIMFNEQNTATTATLKINNDSTTLAPLYYKGLPSSRMNTWNGGDTVLVFFDGTVYQAYPLVTRATTFAWCYSAANSRFKDVNMFQLTDNDITPGLTIRVQFNYSHTDTQAYLRINGGTATKIYWYGQEVTSTNRWDAQDIAEMFFDGTRWQAKRYYE